LIARLSPGQAIRLAAGVEPVAQALVAGAKDWPNGMVEFDGTPLRDVLATANRYSKRRLSLSDPAIGDLKVTGGFRMGDQSALAASLAAAFGLRVDRQPGGDLRLSR
jgi:transmembrane sensor